MEEYAIIFVLLLFWHALADFPLQGDFIARAKNANTAIPGISWQYVLGTHAFIHAVGVVFITNSWILGAIEFILHTVIDLTKNKNVLNFVEDQACHIACKMLYIAVLTEASRTGANLI